MRLKFDTSISCICVCVHQNVRQNCGSFICNVPNDWENISTAIEIGGLRYVKRNEIENPIGKITVLINL